MASQTKITNDILAERIDTVGKKLDTSIENQEKYRKEILMLQANHSTEDTARFADQRAFIEKQTGLGEEKHAQNIKRLDAIEKSQIYNRALVIGATMVIGLFWTIVTVGLTLLIAAASLGAMIYFKTQSPTQGERQQEKYAQEMLELLRRNEIEKRSGSGK